MEHEGKALAADETHHHQPPAPGLISVHVRAAVTWLSIFPLAMLGMWVESLLVPSWSIPVRALMLTIVVVPLSVYVLVPRLLLLVRFVARRGARL
ncbi:hypothetical protein ELQ90_08165 [Labedella phragmitis]|uniref:Uncharacterized protein n=2 Tax=Labedella TaxID=390250 RepID=A0A3S3ZH89_9MICO|nr:MULTISPECIES: hypothetical protein [Labedella]RWZ50810.1 hypothetical protein ELQ90_08165 [Labedella phragmitis]RWZ59479.1 hypothetical protein ELQ92_11575 [Labedella populi]